jgi:hypothetical protein
MANRSARAILRARGSLLLRFGARIELSGGAHRRKRRAREDLIGPDCHPVWTQKRREENGHSRVSGRH